MFLIIVCNMRIVPVTNSQSDGGFLTLHIRHGTHKYSMTTAARFIVARCPLLGRTETTFSYTRITLLKKPYARRDRDRHRVPAKRDR
jgi:hypothetical protein